MGSSAPKVGMRGRPRYRLTETDPNVLRFLSSKNKRIYSTFIFDISETGISFTTTHRLAPPVGELIKMEFVPIGGMQIACLGKVIRIEEPKKNSFWAKFPDTVKVGIAFEDMPLAYRKVITEGLHKAFEANKSSRKADVIEINPVEEWLRHNWASFFGTILLVLFLGFGMYVVFENADRLFPKANSPWAQGFFDKMIQQKK